MRLLRLVCFVILLLTGCIVSAPQSRAIEVVPYDPSTAKTDSPVIISAYSFKGPKVDYVQIFNTSSEVIDLSDWRVEYRLVGQETVIELGTLAGLLKPLDYVLIADAQTIPTADFAYTLSIPDGVMANAISITLVPPLYLTHSATLKVDPTTSHWQRNISTATGKYLTTFSPANPTILYGGGLYEYAPETSLQISEILANPRSCSPLETTPDCRDYVKLFNPTDQPINLSALRLRNGYQGQAVTASNTYSLQGVVEPGHYAAVSMSADNRPVSVTNSGGFVWLEDAYGVRRYDNTVQEYPDASADTKKGQAWAYDSTDGLWKWTIQPTPIDGPSVFPVPIATKPAAKASALSPCREDQYRSEETGRCRSITSGAATVLTACAPDQERNPETNRCRKLATAEAQLTPCKEGQERNPDTNRCRNAPGVLSETAFAVEPIVNAGKAFTGWWAVGGLGTLAVGRGVWQWRSEMLEGIRKVSSFFTSGK